MKNFLQLALLSILVFPTYAQRGKLPPGTKLSGRQKLNLEKCEVCLLVKKNSKGEDEYFYYDVVQQEMIFPEGSEIIQSKIMEKGPSAFTYRMPDGKILSKIAIASKSGKIERPVRVIEQPNDFKGFEKIDIKWYYYTQKLIWFGVHESAGEKKYALYDFYYSRINEFNDWEVIDNAIYRTNKHGYFELLKPDRTVYPDRNDPSLLGFIPTPDYGIFILAHWIENQTKYSVVNTYEAGVNPREQVIKSLSDPIYTSYGLILPKSFEHNGGDEWLTLMMSNENQYDMFGQADGVLFNDVERFDLTYDPYVSLWFSESDPIELLNKTEAKWRESMVRNKKYWEDVEERNRISREKWQNEMREKEFKEALKDFRYCQNSGAPCREKYGSILPAEVMDAIEASVERARRQQAELDAIPSATEMNYVTFDDHVMGWNGYTRKVWDGKKWTYIKD